MSYIGTTKIGKIYLGNTEIVRAYLGTNLVFQKGSQPQPVQTVAYIRGGADGSYIDTGITADDTVKVIVWARNFNPGSGWLFGSRLAVNSSAFGLGAFSAAATGKIGCDFGTEVSATDQFANLSHYHKYEVSSEGFIVDDTAIVSVSSDTFSNGLNISLFGMNTNGAHGNLTLPVDICACKIYKTGALVRDFTAVNSPSVGLYDSVSQTLFTNAGSGSFTYGMFDRNAYTPLEYIECSGAQYFDTGIYGSYSSPIVLKVQPTNTSPQWTDLLGYRNLSNSSCGIGFGTATANQDNMRIYWRFGANDTGGQAFSGSTSNKLTGKDVVMVKSNATLTVYKDNTQIGTNAKSGVSTSFTTNGTLYLGAINGSSYYFIGRIYFCSIGSVINLIPAKIGSRVGMYDTLNDVLYESATNTPFVAGPEL